LAQSTGEHLFLLLSFFSKQSPVRWTTWVGSGVRGWLGRNDHEWPAVGGPMLEENNEHESDSET
jgi:hypothetical protein